MSLEQSSVQSLRRRSKLSKKLDTSSNKRELVLILVDCRSSNNDSNTGSDSNVKVFMDQNEHWSLQDIEGEQEVMLTRDFDDEKIVCPSFESS
jgi:hypothetical protein